MTIEQFQDQVAMELLGLKYEQAILEVTANSILHINRVAQNRFLNQPHRVYEKPFIDREYNDAQCNYTMTVSSTSLYTHADHNTLS